MRIFFAGLCMMLAAALVGGMVVSHAYDKPAGAYMAIAAGVLAFIGLILAFFTPTEAKSHHDLF